MPTIEVDYGYDDPVSTYEAPSLIGTPRQVALAAAQRADQVKWAARSLRSHEEQAIDACDGIAPQIKATREVFRRADELLRVATKAERSARWWLERGRIQAKAILTQAVRECQAAGSYPMQREPRAVPPPPPEAEAITIEGLVARAVHHVAKEVARAATIFEVPEKDLWKLVQAHVQAHAVPPRERSRKVEVRLPAGGWIKRVKSVAATAKTGHDWEGDMLRDGKLVDLLTGSLLVWGAFEAGGQIDLGYVASDGRIEWWAYGFRGQEWAIRLRAVARAYLAGGDERDEALALGLEQRRALDVYQQVAGAKGADSVEALAARAVSDDLDAAVAAYSRGAKHGES